MTDSVYLFPVTLVSGPQAVEGDAVRLGGSMAYAREFALVLRRDGEVAERIVTTARGMAAAIARLPDLAAREAGRQWDNLRKVHAPLQLGARTVRLDQPQVMGILNVTPDSFSDGGQHDAIEAGRAHAAAMLEAGAAIIDIGGESTRPGASATFEDEEIRRVVPAVEYCASMGAAISVDTRRAGVLAGGLPCVGVTVAQRGQRRRHAKPQRTGPRCPARSSESARPRRRTLSPNPWRIKTPRMVLSRPMSRAAPRDSFTVGGC